MELGKGISKFCINSLIRVNISDFTSSAPGLLSSLIFRSGPPSIKAVPNKDGSIASFKIPWWKPLTFKTGKKNINAKNSSNRNRNQNTEKCTSGTKSWEVSCTIPLKPLASAPFRTESDISVTAAKSTLDPAVLNYRATNFIVLVSAEAQRQTYPQIK